MHQQLNPFFQHAIRHGQVLLGESNSAVALSHGIVSACDDIIMSINSGNIQGAINSAQIARNMASQAAQATQHLNQAINERMDMAAHVLSRIQYKISELSNALQAVRSISATGFPEGLGYGATMPYQQNITTFM